MPASMVWAEGQSNICGPTCELDAGGALVRICTMARREGGKMEKVVKWAHKLDGDRAEETKQ